MMAEVLPPGVQHREKADLGAEMLRDRQRWCATSRRPRGTGSCRRVPGVLERDRGDLVGNGEDDMEILRVEKLRPPSLDPFARGRATGTWGSCANGSCCKRSVVRHSGRTARHGLRAPTFGSARWQSSLRVVRSIARPSAALARQHRSDGIYPPLPDLSGPRAGRQKCSGAGGEEALGIGRGSSSSGLVAAQTLLVAIRRY